MKYAFFVFFLLGVPPVSAQTMQGVVSVIDGDTLDMHGQRIRLHGIDSPESRQNCHANGGAWRCGAAAANALADYIARGSVRCETMDVDRYGRSVAVCFKGNVNLNDWMVRSGWAVAYRYFSHDYDDAEVAAKVAKRGIWRGTFEMPWDWRRNNR